MPNDDVVMKLDAQDATGIPDALGQLLIGVRRIGFSARVVVHEHDGVGGGQNGHSEAFTGMHRSLAQPAHAEDMMSSDAQPDVEQEDDDVFAVGVERGAGGDVLSPIMDGRIRAGHSHHGLGLWAFAKRDHTPFFWERANPFGLGRLGWCISIHRVAGWW